MLVSSVGYLTGNTDKRVYAELGKARVSNVFNQGLNVENNRAKNDFIQMISEFAERFTNPELKNSQKALDMIA